MVNVLQLVRLCYAPDLYLRRKLSAPMRKLALGTKSVESLCRIGAQISEQDLAEHFIPLVKRLTAGEWFTAWVSLCGLFHIVYPSASEVMRIELKAIYGQPCQDDMPMDDQDSIWLLAVEDCLNLGKLLKPQDYVAHILPVIINFSQDKLWCVRCMVTNQLYELCEAVGLDPTRYYRLTKQVEEMTHKRDKLVEQTKESLTKQIEELTRECDELKTMIHGFKKEKKELDEGWKSIVKQQQS